MKLITSTDLEQWGKTRESQEKLPLLIRRLIINNIGFENITFIDMPGGDSIWKPGPDGKFIPKVQNILGEKDKIYTIEFGQNRDTKKKFIEDLKKRTKTLKNKSNNIFCFITTHKVKDKEKILNKAKKSIKNSNLWKEIKIFDADHIETWLDQDPATMAWLANILGKHINGVISFNSYWETWKSSTFVPIDEDIILARKNTYSKEITQWLLQDSGIIKIKTDSRKESVLVFLSSILKSNLNIDNISAIKSQIIIVEDKDSWNNIIKDKVSRKLILIPMFGIPENLGILINKNYKIFIPYNYNDGKENEKDIVYIEPLNNHILFSILQKKMESFEDINNLLQKLGDKATLIHLQRRLEKEDIPLPKPEWVNKNNWSILLLSALVGSWDENNKKDTKSISKIFNMPYKDIVLKLSEYIKIEEAPIKKRGTIWIALNPDITINYLLKYLTKEVFNNYIKTTRSILSVINPIYNTPKEKRSFFNFENKIGKYYSKDFIEGISKGYAILSSFQNIYDLNLKSSIESSINKIFYKKDWKTWATLSKSVSLLAEAAPNSFLNSLKDIVEQRKKVIKDIYNQSISLDNSFYFGSEYLFIDILSSLEILSWFDGYIVEATQILINLESIQKTDTKIVNSPLNSLKKIYCPWYPNTAVSLENREKILDNLIKGNKNIVIFNLLLGLLYSEYQTTSHTSRPLYTNIPKHQYCSEKELSDFYTFIFEKILTFINDDIIYWEKTINIINSLTKTDFDKLISKINNINWQDKNQDLKNKVFQLLNHYIKKAEYFIRIQTNKKNIKEYNYKIKNIKKILKNIKTTDSIEQNIQLFSDGIVWDYTEKDNEKELINAIKNIIDEHGIKGIIDFAKKIDNSQILGSKLAQILKANDIKYILNNKEKKNDKIRNLIANLFARTILIHGNNIIDQIFDKKWSNEYKIFLLTTIFKGKEYWNWIDKNKFSILYWENVQNIFADSDEEYTIAVEKLNEYQNFSSMLKLISFQIHTKKEHRIKNEDIINLLEGLSYKDKLTTNIDRYHLTNIFKILQNRENVNIQKLFQLEMKYFDLFSNNKKIEPITIYKQLKSSPNFFVEILSVLFSSKRLNKNQKNNKKLKYIAQKLYIKIKNSFFFDNEKEFFLWLSNLQNILNKLKSNDKKLYRISIRTLGQMFAHSPKDFKDNIYPITYVRKAIESFNDIEDLKDGIYIGKLNSIGARFVDPVDPGKDYKKWAKEFKTNADKLRFEYPKTAKILDFLAFKYLEIGKMRDNDML